MSLIKIDPIKVSAKVTAERIEELKQLLRDTDYVAMPDYDKDKADVITQRAAWRTELRELEAVVWPVKP